MDVAAPLNVKRRLDQQVAEKIFGMDVKYAPGTFDDYTVEEDGRHKPIPRFSSDLPAAWRVMVWMADLGDTVTLSAENGRTFECAWTYQGRTARYRDPSPARAICCCALDRLQFVK